LPINFFGVVVSISFPCIHFGLHGFHIGNPAIKALSFQDTEFDFYNIQDGPQFLLSGTSDDDAGSYIRFGSVDNEVSSGGSVVYGTYVDDIDYIAWIEGSSLVNNMYPVSQDWTTTFTLTPGAEYFEDYDRYFDNSGLYSRYSNAEIEGYVYSYA